MDGTDDEVQRQTGQGGGKLLFFVRYVVDLKADLDRQAAGLGVADEVEEVREAARPFAGDVVIGEDGARLFEEVEVLHHT